MRVAADGRPATIGEVAGELGRDRDDIAAAYRGSTMPMLSSSFRTRSTSGWRTRSASRRPRTTSRLQVAGWTGTCAWDALRHPGGVAHRRGGRDGVRLLRRAAGARNQRRRARARCGSPRSLRRPGSALVGRHRLHLKHDGLPPVGGAPAAVARRDWLRPRRDLPGDDVERARETVVEHSPRPGLGGHARSRNPRRSWTTSGLPATSGD